MTDSLHSQDGSCNTRYSDPQEKQETHGNTICASSESEPKGPDVDVFATFLEELNSGLRSSLSLADYVECAALHNWNGWDGEWWTRSWTFTRCMKGHPELEGLSADDALERILEVINVESLDPNQNEELLWVLDEDGSLQFLTEWDKVRYKPGYSPLENATDLADAHPLAPERCKGGKLKRYARFVSIAGWLQVVMGERNILLPCAEISRILRCDKSQVSRLRQLAIKDGYLKVEKGHLFRPGTKGRATEFQFDKSRFQVLEHGAQQ